MTFQIEPFNNPEEDANLLEQALLKIETALVGLLLIYPPDHPGIVKLKQAIKDFRK